MEANKKQQPFLQKKEKGPYQDFFQAGVERLQELSHLHWTDYNEHDPGVTILENLCFTLTDILYKNETDIQDVLLEGKREPIESGDNALFKDREILTTNPITPKDISRVIMDSVHNVKNVWVKPLNNHHKSLSGCYRIEVQPYEFPDPSAPSYTYKIAELPNRVRAVFHKHRNLCEQVAEVVLLRPLELKLAMKLTLVEDINGEKALADVFYELQNYISKTIDFYALNHELDRLKGTDNPINQIFNGPALTHGFVPEEELEPRTHAIDLRALMRKVNETTHQHADGPHHSVLGIDAFQLYYRVDDQWIPLSGHDGQMKLTLPANTVPELSIKHARPGELKFRQAEIDYKADLMEVKKQLTYLEGREYGHFRSVADSTKTMGIPQGQARDVGSYYSIREQFPMIYGVGSFGLSGEETEQRIAQAWQLKGYLLPFDQLMTNGLAQLTNLYQLFDLKEGQYQSYFYKQLEDNEALQPLLQHRPEEDYMGPKTWNSVLDELNGSHDTNSIARLNDIADHLLARFNETFPRYALRNINTKSYGDELAEASFEEDLLGLKREFLSRYPSMSYNRARGVDLWNTDPQIPALLEKIGLLLGIRDTSANMLYQQVNKSGISVEEQEDLYTQILPQRDALFAQEELDLAALEAIQELTSQEEVLRETVFFTGETDDLLDIIVRRGIVIENYQIQKSTDESAPRFYLILKTQEDHRNRHLIHVGSSAKEVIQARDRMRSKLLDLSKHSEGIYMIEHLLLAPDFTRACFGFRFDMKPDAEHHLTFHQAELHPYVIRESLFSDLAQLSPSETRPIFKAAQQRESHVVELLGPSGKPVAWASVNSSTQAQQLAKQLNDLYCYLPIESGMISPMGVTYYGDEAVDEDFYSYRISFVMPSSPARFQRHKFKRHFKRLLQQHAPAHLAYDAYWLNYEDMKLFEELYQQWSTLPPEVPPVLNPQSQISVDLNSQQRDELALQLIRLLKKWLPL